MAESVPIYVSHLTGNPSEEILAFATEKGAIEAIDTVCSITRGYGRYGV